MKIVIGIKGPTEERTSGLYDFDFTSRASKESVKGSEIGKRPSLEFEVTKADGDKELKSPRYIKTINKKLYSLVDRRVYEIVREDKKEGKINVQKLSISNQFDISDLIKNPTSEINKQYKKIFATKNQMISLVCHGDKLFMALYASNKFKTETIRGFLFKSSLSEPSNLELLNPDEFKPTGPLIIDKNNLSVVSGRRLNNYSLDQDLVKIEGFPIQLNGEILSVKKYNNFTICADNKGNYLLIDPHERHKMLKGEGSEILIEDYDNNLLSTEATSVTISEYQGINYALFGLDYGVINVYKLPASEGTEPEIEFVKRIYLLSDKELIQDNQDNHVWNLHSDKDSIHFNLRKMYIRLGMKQILEEDYSPNLSPVDRTKLKQNKYLNQLMEDYKAVRICELPHRIVTWDIF